MRSEGGRGPTGGGEKTLGGGGNRLFGRIRKRDARPKNALGEKDRIRIAPSKTDRTP